MSQNKRSNGFAMYAWGVLAFNLGVILWGAYVRASGSGAGCGSHWPLCNGEVLPRSNSVQTLIEFTHRMTSGLSVLLIAGLIVFAYIRFPKKHLARPGALATGFFILTEAAVGAGLVLFELVAHNASVARALFISVHLLNTFLLLGALTLTAWWGSGGPAIYLRRQGWFLLVIGSAIITTLVVGISGAVT